MFKKNWDCDTYQELPQENWDNDELFQKLPEENWDNDELFQKLPEENWDNDELFQKLPDPESSCYHSSSINQKKNFSKYSHTQGKKFEIRGDTWDKNDTRRRDYNQREKTESNFSPNDLVMKIEESKIGRIVGKQGSKIRELQSTTGTKIKIGSPCEENYYMKNVIISGDEESKKQCQKLIKELVGGKQATPIYSAEVKKETDVPLIDWDLINQGAVKAEAEKWEKCPPLKKDFYFEDPEVANMSQEEVESFRINNNNIIVKNVFGKDEKILNPVKTFAQAFKHYPEIMTEIEKQGFETPSPIQCQAWPILLSGKDLIGIAQTGTGKTLAFLLPALIHIDGQEIPRSQRGGANVLIIAPTRELALQIEKEVEKYSYKDIKSVCVYGGGNRRNQMQIISKGVEIIIATPGRLNDLVEANVIDLTSITYLVLDEADRMLDMGFEPQIRKVLLNIRPDRQSVMTSATWPTDVQKLAERYMINPVQVYVGSLDLAAVHSVTQTVLMVEENEKMDILLDYIKNLTEDEKIIVFVGKKTFADMLSCDLSLSGIRCQCIHGDREQVDREQALEDLKTGAVQILIATDVASRGIDILDITKVFNFNFPKNIEEYVHRVGRTGRAGKTGESITLFTRADWGYAGELIKIMEEADQVVPSELYDMRDRFLNMQQKKKDERTSNGPRGGRGRLSRTFRNSQRH